MKISYSIFLAVFLIARVALGQTTGAGDPSAPPGVANGASDSAPPDPAKVAEYQRRFQQGYALEKQGQPAQALSIYNGILEDEPNAEHSLLEAGRVSLELNEPLKAAVYLDKLHALAPQFPEALELLIQADQELRQDVKVDQLVREFRALRDNSTIPKFHDSLYFEREHLQMGGGSEMIIWQFFDYTQPPNIALKAQLFDAQHQPQRVLLLRYDPAGTLSVRAKDAKLARDEVFMLAEPFYAGTQMTKIDVYQELLATPSYAKARALLLNIFDNSPKPLFSRAVPESAQ